ncbi:hypothetical protein DASC09_008920 [Saccharomycopsis crataegensis]|uniref:Urea transport protein n=1 Tax=Saccharomycopsis crataegensis TaxID=43959 RepID=A0AAV5QFP4_9ASCO|nr:hypothetical protein DASC09_008920 [Saccharomycopsis crataegensis]
MSLLLLNDGSWFDITNCYGTGAGILTTYTEIANVAGLQGLIIYCLSGSLPMFLFAFLGPVIRRQCPHGFVLTEWCFQRFGRITGLALSLATILTLFLFMIGELAAVYFAIETLTTINGVPAVIIECIVTTIYTSIGGFKVSFITDNIQATFVTLLLVIGTCSISSYIRLDPSVDKEPMLTSNKLAWKLLYILPVAIVTNDCFVSGFWLRTFASKSNRDLLIGTSIAAVLLFIYPFLVGFTGIIAVWNGSMQQGDDNVTNAFFYLVASCPKWVNGLILIFTCCLSTCTFDSLQSSMVSTISNDIFRNKLNLFYIRIGVVLVMIPAVVVGLKCANDVLQIYLIADLISACIIPILFLGLSSKFWFLTGWEVVIGSLGGFFAVFVFGTIYYGSAVEGGKLLIVYNSIYVDDWSAFGAFVVAPGFSLVVGFLTLGIRLTVLYVMSKVKNDDSIFRNAIDRSKHHFDYHPEISAVDTAEDDNGIKLDDGGDVISDNINDVEVQSETLKKKKFFARDIFSF